VTVVVGVDGSAPARAALAWAMDEARRRGTRLVAVHVVPRPWAAGAAGGPYGAFVTADMRRQLEKRGRDLLAAEVDAARAAAGGTVEVEQELREGPPAAALLHAAQAADLLVVGSRGHGGFASLVLGSVASQCAAHGRCPVAVVR